MADRDDGAGQAEHEADVLVVDDDPEINALVGAYVQLAGFGYLRALNGDDALHEALCRRPALIVLDLMLPDLDGLEICRRLKAQEATSGIPIVMLTAMDKSELRDKCLQSGAAVYLTKPFDPDRLMSVIRDHAHGCGEREIVNSP